MTTPAGDHAPLPNLPWPILRPLSDADRSAVLRACVRRRFERNQPIVREGQSADSLHLVDSGHVVARVATRPGEETIVNVIGPGQSFGELALIMDAGNRTASIWTIERTETLVLGRRQFEELRQRRPAIDRALVDALAEQVASLTSRVAELLGFPAEVRLARRIVETARAYDAFVPGGTIPVTQPTLGEMAGIKRRRTEDIVRAMKAEGLISAGYGRIVLRDLDGLVHQAMLDGSGPDLELD